MIFKFIIYIYINRCVRKSDSVTDGDENLNCPFNLVNFIQIVDGDRNKHSPFLSIRLTI